MRENYRSNKKKREESKKKKKEAKLNKRLNRKEEVSEVSLETPAIPANFTETSASV